MPPMKTCEWIQSNDNGHRINALEEIEWPIDILTNSNLTYEFFEDCIITENCKGVKIQQFWPQ